MKAHLNLKRFKIGNEKNPDKNPDQMNQEQHDIYFLCKQNQRIFHEPTNKAIKSQEQVKWIEVFTSWFC